MKNWGFYKASAEAYVSFAKSYPTDPKSSDFWYNAGVIFDALNDRANAIYSYRQHFQKGKKSDRHEVFYLMGFLYERNRNWQKAIENYQKYLKSPSSNKPRVIRASYTVADIYDKRLKNTAQAEIWHKKNTWTL